MLSSTKISKKRIPVLLYHIIGDPPSSERKNRESYVSVRRFESQIWFLSSMGYTAITPDVLEEYYLGGGGIPENPVLITFDDGSRSIIKRAAPILSRYGFTALVFLVADCVGKKADWDKRPVHLQDPLLGPEDIRSLRSSGFSFGSHTSTHARLLKIGREKLVEEITDSKRKLEDILGQEIKYIAYPWGEYNQEIEEITRGAGYRVGFTAHQDETGIFSLRRQNVSRSTPIWRFIRKFYSYKMRKMVGIKKSDEWAESVLKLAGAWSNLPCPFRKLIRPVNALI